MKWAIEGVFAHRFIVGGAEFRKALLGLAAQAPVQNLRIVGASDVIRYAYACVRASFVAINTHHLLLQSHYRPVMCLRLWNLVC
jgi:hypothetical protein